MTTSHLPATISKKKKETILAEPPVETPDRPVSTDEAIAAMERQGCKGIPTTLFSDLESIGIFVKKTGVLKTIRARAMITQTRLDEIFKKLVEIANEGKIGKDGQRKPLTLADLAIISKAAGLIAGKQTESQKFAVEMERVRATTSSMGDDEEPPQKSFVPGAKVVVKEEHKHVHYHQNPNGNGNGTPSPLPEKGS